jgi:hypothetical protein
VKVIPTLLIDILRKQLRVLVALPVPESSQLDLKQIMENGSFILKWKAAYNLVIDWFNLQRNAIFK